VRPDIWISGLLGRRKPQFGSISTPAPWAGFRGTILSGSGLLRLHLARCAAAGKATAVSSEITLIEKRRPIPQAKRRGPCGFAGRSRGVSRAIWRLRSSLWGGVTFAGGILPRILDFAIPALFRAAFENKTPYGEMMRGIGTRLILTEDAVLTGMAAIATAPQNYAIDYANRAWR